MNDIVVGMGEALWDVLPEGKKIGGAPANFAYHVSQFGLPSCVVSAVGDDALGKEIVENFTSKGLNQLIAEVPYPTGTVQVEIDQAGVPQYEIKENVAWDNIPYTAHLEAIAEKTKAVCFGSLAQRNVVSRNTINRFLDAMPQTEDSLVVFDVNLRQGFYNKEILCNSMKRCNILKINDEELVTVSRMFGYPVSTFRTNAGFFSANTISKCSFSPAASTAATCSLQATYLSNPRLKWKSQIPSEPATVSRPHLYLRYSKEKVFRKPIPGLSGPQPMSAQRKEQCQYCLLS